MVAEETNPATVARKIMGVEWEKDPFLKEVDLDASHPSCPFRETDVWCRAVRIKGKRKDWVYPRCPMQREIGSGHTRYDGAPPECPLRHGEIVIKRKNDQA